jgi:hypothetical protein
LKICDKELRIKGKLIRTAFLEGEGCQSLEEPEPLLERLRKSRIRIDLFTFIQKLSETSRKYDYSMEWDNLAVLPVSTFEHWSTQQSGFEPGNKARHAEKKVVVREVPVDDVLVRGIWGLTIPQKGGGART